MASHWKYKKLFTIFTSQIYRSIILSQSSELVGVLPVQLSQLLLFQIDSNFLRRKHGHWCLEVHSDLENFLLPVCVLSDFVTTSLLFYKTTCLNAILMV